jgi:hypothetical protein
MDEKDRAILERISNDIKRIADSLSVSKTWYQKITEILLTVVGISGGVFVADQIIKWIRG